MVNARGNSSVLLVESLDMKMTLKKRIASTLAAGVIAISAMLAAPVAANATGNPSKLDQGDLTIACRIKEPTNQYGWKSEKVDSLIDEAAASIDPAKRKQLYAQLVQEANEQLPLWFATEREFYSIVNNKLRNDHNVARWPSSSWYDTWIVEE